MIYICFIGLRCLQSAWCFGFRSCQPVTNPILVHMIQRCTPLCQISKPYIAWLEDVKYLVVGTHQADPSDSAFSNTRFLCLQTHLFVVDFYGKSISECRLIATIQLVISFIDMFTTAYRYRQAYRCYWRAINALLLLQGIVERVGNMKNSQHVTAEWNNVICCLNFHLFLKTNKKKVA